MEYKIFYNNYKKLLILISLPCALLYFSSNNFVLRIVRYNEYITEKPIPVAGMSKARVCVRSLAGIGVSSPTEGMDVCIL